jgi:Glycosyl hydrolases family 2, TIM barrel domain/Glycosyl hydrolases family 2, sugar binding domain/Glycosyl hydrolases family 2
MTALNALKTPAFAIALACAALLSSTVAAAQAPPLQSVIFEGPGGRAPLTRWTLARDPANRGLALGWQRGGFAGATVTVPNVVNVAPYAGPTGARNYEGSVAWYRTSFQAPATGVYALSFQSANFLASVWIDGHAVGSHKGSYLPFEVRRKLTAGSHSVVVRVDWRDPAQQSREGFHRTWFNWGGLDGEVDVRKIGESELSQPAIQTTLTPDAPDATQASVKVTVRVQNLGPGRTITPEGSLAHGAQTIPLSFSPLALAHDRSATATARVSIPAPALWSHASPNLYRLTLAVGDESSYSASVGLRQLTWHGGRVYLNGQQLKLHGASIQEDALGHGDALTPADEGAIVAELAQIGANAVRAQHPLDPALLERLDAAGILVWQGIGPVEGAGNWYSTTPALLSDAERQARTAVLAAQLHPSIFAWNLVDEVAENGRDSQEVAYVQTLARWLHAHDPTRMVAVDVWGDHPPQHAGALYSQADAVAETDYSGWYDSPRDTPSQLAALMRTRLAAMARTFAGKVLVISEFGAESNDLNPSGSPGSYSYQARVLAEHIAVYEADPKLSAMLVWVLRDYPLTPTFSGGSIHGKLPQLKLIEGLNQKGLFTYGGHAKPGVVSTVARMYKALAQG